VARDRTEVPPVRAQLESSKRRIDTVRCAVASDGRESREEDGELATSRGEVSSPSRSRSLVRSDRSSSGPRLHSLLIDLEGAMFNKPRWDDGLRGIEMAAISMQPARQAVMLYILSERRSTVCDNRSVMKDRNSTGCRDTHDYRRTLRFSRGRTTVLSSKPEFRRHVKYIVLVFDFGDSNRAGRASAKAKAGDDHLVLREVDVRASWRIAALGGDPVPVALELFGIVNHDAE
jgi:hypothetical protein